MKAQLQVYSDEESDDYLEEGDSLSLLEEEAAEQGETEEDLSDAEP